MAADQPLSEPIALGPNHDTSAFQSGAIELDQWLHDWALVNHKSGNTRVFVTARGNRVAGYYALATGGVEKKDAQKQIKKGGVPTQIPVLLLARLAVDLSEQGTGLGRGLLADALRRSAIVASDVGVRALLIHARDKTARDFYLHQAEFIASPTDPLHLFIHMKHLRSLIADGL